MINRIQENMIDQVSSVVKAHSEALKSLFKGSWKYFIAVSYSDTTLCFKWIARKKKDDLLARQAGFYLTYDAGQDLYNIKAFRVTGNGDVFEGEEQTGVYVDFLQSPKAIYSTLIFLKVENPGNSSKMFCVSS